MSYKEYIQKRIRSAKLYSAMYFSSAVLLIFIAFIPEVSDAFMLILLSFSAIFAFLGFAYFKYSGRISLQPLRITPTEIVLPYPISITSTNKKIPFESIVEAITMERRNGAVFLRTTEANIIIEKDIVEGEDLLEILKEKGINVRKN